MEGLQHDNPIPSASRIGGLVATGSIFGKDPATGGKFVDGAEAQVAVMFANIRRVAEAAGGTPDNILKLEVWVKAPEYRKIVNQHWLVMFPDEHSRPARHTFIDPDLAGAALVQCSFLAVIA
jgi:2-iminobutanoate/2-iminopropanoate deaminase